MDVSVKNVTVPMVVETQEERIVLTLTKLEASLLYQICGYANIPNNIEANSFARKFYSDMTDFYHSL